jgi:hypothetical protein
MDRYEDMTVFLTTMLSHKAFRESYLEHDPLVQELLAKIKEFHNQLINIFSVPVQDSEGIFEEESYEPDEINMNG